MDHKTKKPDDKCKGNYPLCILCKTPTGFGGLHGT